MPSTDEEMASRGANWHNSSVETILGCPRQYLLSYEMLLPTPTRLNTIAGTALHSCVEQHELARMGGDADGISQDDMQTWGLAEIDALMGEATAAQLAAYGCKAATGKAGAALAAAPQDEQAAAGRAALRGEVAAAVENWWSTPVDGGPTIREFLMGMTPLAVEVYLKAAVVGGCDEQAGTLDGIYRTADGEVVIVDQKTSAKMYGWGPKDDDHRDQPTFYAALVAFCADELGVELTGLPKTYFAVSRRALPKRFSPTWVGAAIAVVTPEPADLARLGAQVRQAQAIKDHGTYPPNPDYEWCKTCPFRDRCVMGDGTLAVSAHTLLGRA